MDVRVTSSPSAQPYMLSLTVTNKETGFARIKTWSVYIINSLGEGLLVGHTKDGGESSELALLACSTLTYGYKDSPRVTDDLFEIGNGQHITGRVNHILARSATDMNAVAVSSFNEDIICVATDDHLMALNPLNYSVSRQDRALFSTSSVPSYKVDFISNVGNYSSVALIQGKAYVCCDMLDDCYGNSSYPPANYDFDQTNTCAHLDDQGWIYHFDTKLHKFYYLPGWTAASGSFTELSEKSTPDQAFLSDKSSVACGMFKGGRAAFILTDNAGSYWLVVLNGFDSAEPVISQLNAPNIAKAEGFAFCDNSDIFYYYYNNTIYSTILSGGSAVTRAVSWTPDNGNEKLTMIQHYRQAWYGTHQHSLSGTGSNVYRFPLSTHRLQMVLVTYNEKSGEGKIYLKPFNVSTGLFSAFKDNGTYGGFGEITAVGSTMR